MSVHRHTKTNLPVSVMPLTKSTSGRAFLVKATSMPLEMGSGVGIHVQLSSVVVIHKGSSPVAVDDCNWREVCARRACAIVFVSTATSTRHDAPQAREVFPDPFRLGQHQCLWFSFGVTGPGCGRQNFGNVGARWRAQ